MRTRRLSPRLSPLLLVAALSLTGCDEDDPTPDDAAGTTTTDPAPATDTAPATDDGGGDSSGAAGQGRCAPDQAVMTCDMTDCAFDPTTVDCAAACANIATLCAGNDCDAQCTGLESDMTLCMAGCEGTKSLACSNVVFGCYAMDSTCDGVGGCVDANL